MDAAGAGKQAEDGLGCWVDDLDVELGGRNRGARARDTLQANEGGVGGGEEGGGGEESGLHDCVWKVDKEV